MSILLAQIQVPAPIEVIEHDPIHVTSGIIVDESWAVEHDWTITKPASGREYK